MKNDNEILIWTDGACSGNPGPGGWGVLIKNRDFSQQISKIYRKMAKQKRWKMVDATKSKQDVHDDIMKIFGKKIGI